MSGLQRLAALDVVGAHAFLSILMDGADTGYSGLKPWPVWLRCKISGYALPTAGLGAPRSATAKIAARDELGRNEEELHCCRIWAALRSNLDCDIGGDKSKCSAVLASEARVPQSVVMHLLTASPVAL